MDFTRKHSKDVRIGSKLLTFMTLYMTHMIWVKACDSQMTLVKEILETINITPEPLDSATNWSFLTPKKKLPRLYTDNKAAISCYRKYLIQSDARFAPHVKVRVPRTPCKCVAHWLDRPSVSNSQRNPDQSTISSRLRYAYSTFSQQK